MYIFVSRIIMEKKDKGNYKKKYLTRTVMNREANMDVLLMMFFQVKNDAGFIIE